MDRSVKAAGCGGRWAWWWWTLVAWAVAAAAGSVLAADGLIPRRVLDPLDQCPCWTGRTEGLMLWRDAPQGVSLFNAAPDTIGPTTLLDASNLASDMAAGPRFTLFRHTGDLGAIEFNYLRVEDFTAGRALPSSAGGYVFGGDVLCCPLETNLNEAAASMSSELQSFELNRRFPTDGRIQWLAGFRWVQWNEALSLDATTDLQAPPQFVDIDTRTTNDLYGMQVGLDSILWRSGGRFWIEGLGKAGVYYNNAGQFTSFENSFPPERVAGGTSTARVGFVGELGVTGVWQVTDWLAVRTGWVAFWLGGLAQAPNQLAEQCLICDTRPVTQGTDTGGSVFLNGITLGLEARW